MRSRKGGIDEVPGVGMPGMDRQTVTVLGDATQVIDVAEVELGVDTHGKQVHRQVDDIDIAGAFAVAKQRPRDAVGPRHDAELRGGHTAAAIIVGVQRQNDLVPTADGAQKPLDDISVDVWCVALHRGWQVQDDLVGLVVRLDDIHHGLTNLHRELGLRQRKTLRRVLIAHGGSRNGLLQISGECGGTGGYVNDPGLVKTEDHATLQGIRRVVEVHDGPGGPLDSLVRALDQLLTALCEHLDGHILGDEILADQQAHEVIVGLTGRGKTNFDLLESYLHEDFKHAPLALDVHRVDERLVAITQVHRAPQRGLLNAAIGPGAVVQHDRDPWLVLLEWHLLGCHGFGRHTTYPYTQ